MASLMDLFQELLIQSNSTDPHPIYYNPRIDETIHSSENSQIYSIMVHLLKKKTQPLEPHDFNSSPINT